MTMDSWGGEDSAALFAQQEEEARLERERLAAYQAGPLPPPPPTTGQPAGNFFGQQFQQPPPPVGDLMAPIAPPMPPAGINPTQGGFRQTEMQPDPNATTDNPLALLGGAHRCGTALRVTDGAIVRVVVVSGRRILKLVVTEHVALREHTAHGGLLVRGAIIQVTT